MTVIWETPAPVEKKKTKYERLCEELVERPGQWGRLDTAKNHKAAYQRMFQIRSEVKGFDSGHFEFTARKLGNNQGAIYGRFIGQVPYENGIPYETENFTISTM